MSVVFYAPYPALMLLFFTRDRVRASMTALADRRVYARARPEALGGAGLRLGRFFLAVARLRGRRSASRPAAARRRKTSSTARLNAASLAFDGAVKPDSLRTNCSDAARTSSSVAGGAKLNSVLMLLHMPFA